MPASACLHVLTLREGTSRLPGIPSWPKLRRKTAKTSKTSQTTKTNSKHSLRCMATEIKSARSCNTTTTQSLPMTAGRLLLLNLCHELFTVQTGGPRWEGGRALFPMHKKRGLSVEMNPCPKVQRLPCGLKTNNFGQPICSANCFTDPINWLAVVGTRKRLQKQSRGCIVD